jgi:hypothetical protein
MKRLLLAIAVLVLSVSVAQKPVGAVSYIDWDTKEGIEKELFVGEGRRPGGLVEVIHYGRYTACAKGGDLSKCVTPATRFEWSVPFMTKQSALAVQEALSKAWNRFEARMTWRMNSLINANPDLGQLAYSYALNCPPDLLTDAGKPLTHNDPYLDAWNKNPAFPLDAKLFCDAMAPVPGPILAPRPSHVPSACPTIDVTTDWPEVSRRWMVAKGHAMAVYYPLYWKEVEQIVTKHMPYALKWDGLYQLDGKVGTEGGSMIQPVSDLQPNTLMYEKLAARAQKMYGNMGALYVLQQYPKTIKDYKIKPEMLSAAFQRPIAANPNKPGVPQIEKLKYQLSYNAGIFSAPGVFSNYLTARTDTRPGAQLGLADPKEYEGVGHVPFLRLFTRLDNVSRELAPVSPLKGAVRSFCMGAGSCKTPANAEYHRPIVLYRKCLQPPLMTPVIFPTYLTDGIADSITRVHADFMSVPEGYRYPLQHVKGLPQTWVPGQPLFTPSEVR